ncbi:ABC transporter permease [Salinirussus salinus]|uniref:ABC transporter permease n=1 Tax=Salinirussus salinus TaxID=1198300 RepID=UPI00135AD301|nr:ABC transporter permease [Salinirussus salinus]
MSRLARVRALAGITGAQLWHDRTRTVLAVLGVAMAVLASVLLVSVGAGVVETGQQKFDQSGRDLWVTGGPVQLRPGSVGGFQNSLVGAHDLADSIENHEAVSTAVPMTFQTVYASANTSEFRTVVAVGAPARGPSVTITEGRPFQYRDVHYGDGNYSGPMTYEAVLNERAADLLGVSVNDTVHVGGTLAAARQHEFRVVGISPTYSRFVGAPTATLHLSELQELVGTTASDRATFISVRLTDGASVTAVERDLATRYPEYTVRTNRDQLEATLQDQAVVLVSGASLVALAVLAGVLLLLNLQLSFVTRHRERFGAVKATGVSGTSLLVLVGCNAVCIGLLGGVVGVALAVPSLWGVNYVAEAVTGFQGLVTVSPAILLGGLGLAVAVSCLGGIVAGVYLARMRVLPALRSE